MVRLQFKCFGLLLSSLWGQLAKKVEFKTFAKCPAWKFPAFSGICKGVSVYTPRPHIIHRFGEWAVVAGRSGFKGQVLKLGSSSLCLVYLGKSVLIYYSFSFRGAFRVRVTPAREAVCLVVQKSLSLSFCICYSWILITPSLWWCSLE